MCCPGKTPSGLGAGTAAWAVKLPLDPGLSGHTEPFRPCLGVLGGSRSAPGVQCGPGERGSSLKVKVRLHCPVF